MNIGLQWLKAKGIEYRHPTPADIEEGLARHLAGLPDRVAREACRHQLTKHHGQEFATRIYDRGREIFEAAKRKRRGRK